MKTACIILNYNNHVETADYVHSIELYTIYDYIIVVDNNSTDCSYESLKELENNRIKVVKTKQNGGYGSGNNYGIKIARTKYDCRYAFISNPDVTYDEKCPNEMLKYIKNHKECMIVAPVQYNGFSKKMINEPAWKLPTFTSYAFGNLKLLRFLSSKERYCLNKEEQIVDCVPGAFLLVDIDMFLSVGGYDENLFLYCEESTLAFRTLKKGFYTCLLTNERYYHFVSSSIGKSIPSEVKRYKLIFQGRMYYLKKYLCCNAIQLLVAKLCFKTILFEKRIQALICKRGI